MVHMVSIFRKRALVGTGLILKPLSDVHSKSRFNSKTCEAFQIFSTMLSNICHYEPTNLW